MITSNIFLGENVFIAPTASINNVKIGDNTKISNNVKVFGSKEHLLTIGSECYIGPNCLIEGFNEEVIIGNYVSFAQNVNLMSGSGPNASKKLQKLFPINFGKVVIGDHSWIGANSVIMNGITLGNFCIVAANSFVNNSFPDFSIIGGTPAKVIRTLTKEEIQILLQND